MADEVKPEQFVRFEALDGGVYILPSTVRSVQGCSCRVGSTLPSHVMIHMEKTNIAVIGCDADAVMVRLGLPVAK